MSITSLSKVYLVGAGPGDPGLLTVRAAEVLRAADVVVYDRLVSREILDLAPSGAARINVGKQPHCHRVPQEEINDLLVSMARDGRHVVRLKGGDPYMFGRGSEEALHLLARGVEFEIVPGVTAATGCAAAVGVPLTHRGLATSVRYITGHCQGDKELNLDWRGLADSNTTLVIYMGAASMAEIAVRLICNGLASETPVMAISQGTTRRQRKVLSTLGQVADDVANAGLPSPVLFIVGRVVDLAQHLNQEIDHEVVAFDLSSVQGA